MGRYINNGKIIIFFISYYCKLILNIFFQRKVYYLKMLEKNKTPLVTNIYDYIIKENIEDKNYVKNNYRVSIEYNVGIDEEEITSKYCKKNDINLKYIPNTNLIINKYYPDGNVLFKIINIRKRIHYDIAIVQNYPSMSIAYITKEALRNQCFKDYYMYDMYDGACTGFFTTLHPKSNENHIYNVIGVYDEYLRELPRIWMYIMQICNNSLLDSNSEWYYVPSYFIMRCYQDFLNKFIYQLLRKRYDRIHLNDIHPENTILFKKLNKITDKYEIDMERYYINHPYELFIESKNNPNIRYSRLGMASYTNIDFEYLNSINNPRYYLREANMFPCSSTFKGFKPGEYGQPLYGRRVVTNTLPNGNVYSINYAYALESGSPVDPNELEYCIRNIMYKDMGLIPYKRYDKDTKEKKYLNNMTPKNGELKKMYFKANEEIYSHAGEIHK